MRFLIGFLLLFVLSLNVAAGTNFWDGDAAQFLTDKLSLKAGTKIFEAPSDPTSVATDAPLGSISIFSGKIYIKNDAGSTTNWSIVTTLDDIIQTKELLIDSSEPVIVGVRYQSYATAVTYILTQGTPSFGNRWVANIVGTLTENITLRDFVYIGSLNVEGLINGSVSSGTSLIVQAYRVADVTVLSVDAPIVSTILELDRVNVTDQEDATGLGLVFFRHSLMSKDGANVAIDITWDNFELTEGSQVTGMGNFNRISVRTGAYLTFIGSPTGFILNLYDGAGTVNLTDGETLTIDAMYSYSGNFYGSGFGFGTNPIVLIVGGFESEMVNSIVYGVDFISSGAGTNLKVYSIIRASTPQSSVFSTAASGTLSIKGDVFSGAGFTSINTVDAINELASDKKDNEAIAAVDPIATDDGYPLGTLWVNTATNSTFVIVDNTATAAVWNPVIASVAGSPLTTKGDLFTYDTGDQRLGVGTNGQVLSANSAQATGLNWIDSIGAFDAIDTFANLDALTKVDGKEYYSTTDKRIYIDNGSTLLKIPVDSEKTGRYEFATDPLVTDDSASNYRTADLWVNNVDNDHFILVDSSVGAAVWARIPTEADLLLAVSTGIITGLEVTINGGDAALFDVAAGTGIIVDWSTPTSPTRTVISYAGSTGNTVGSIGAQFTGLIINSSGTLTQLAGGLATSIQKRQNLVLQTLVHIGGTVIEDITKTSIPAYQKEFAFIDYIDALGPINSGNKYSENGANLQIDKASGTTTLPFINRVNDAQNPAIATNIAQSPVSPFNYSYQDGASGFTLVGSQTVIDPTSFDDGDGTLGTVPNNDYTIQRIYHFGSTNITTITFGQATYNNLEDAENAIFSESPTIDPQITGGGNFVTALLIREDVTDIASAVSGGTAKFVDAITALGGSSGGAAAVDSVFGRIGAVLAVSGDYDADEIDDAATTKKFITTLLTTKGDIASYTTAAARLGVGTDGQILSANSVQATGLEWITNSALSDPLTTNGDIIARLAGVTDRLPVGTNGQVLKVTAGLPAWGTDSTSTVNVNFTDLPAVTIETSSYDSDGNAVSQASFDPHDFANDEVLVAFGPLLGSNIVIDGTFPDLTNWIIDAGTPVAVANELIIENGGSNEALHQDPLTANTWYTLTFDYRLISGAHNIDFSIRKASGSETWSAATASGVFQSIVVNADGSYSLNFFSGVDGVRLSIGKQVSVTASEMGIKNVTITKLSGVKDIVENSGHLQTSTQQIPLPNTNYCYKDTVTKELKFSKTSTSVAGGRAVCKLTFEQ